MPPSVHNLPTKRLLNPLHLLRFLSLHLPRKGKSREHTPLFPRHVIKMYRMQLLNQHHIIHCLSLYPPRHLRSREFSPLMPRSVHQAKRMLCPHHVLRSEKSPMFRSSSTLSAWMEKSTSPCQPHTANGLLKQQFHYHRWLKVREEGVPQVRQLLILRLMRIMMLIIPTLATTFLRHRLLQRKATIY